jgi:hypothetical protein
MSLKGPINKDNADLYKIHNEVAQIVHQRMVNTTFAITLLGIFGIFTVRRPTPPVGSDIDPVLLWSSLLLSCILFIVYMYNCCLVGMLRIFTSYLRVTENSGWEEDWAKYRGKYFYFGYTKAQTIVFVALVAISTFWPSVIAKVYALKIESSIWLFSVNLALGVAFLVIMIFIGSGKLLNIEPNVMKKWQELKNAKDNNDKSNA